MPDPNELQVTIWPFKFLAKGPVARRLVFPVSVVLIAIAFGIITYCLRSLFVLLFVNGPIAS